MRKGMFGALLVIVLVAGVAMAQEEPPGVRCGGWGGFSFGPQKIDTGDLSHHLSSINVDMSDYQPVIGAYGYGVFFKHLIVGARGSYVLVDQVGEVSNVELTTFTYGGELGGAIFNNRWGILFPFVGAGRVKSRLEMSDKNEAQVEAIFGDGKYFSKYGNYVTFGVQYDYLLPVTPVEGGFGMFVAGLRLGATMELSPQDWVDENGDDPVTSPDYSFDTFFFLFDIGFGGGV